MNIAQALNLETGQKRTITAKECHLERQRTGVALPEVLFVPKQGDPLDLRKSGKVKAHFARARGFGPSNPARGALARQGRAAFADGTKTLLVLDGVFGYKGRSHDFSHLPRSNKVWPIADWIFANRADFNAVPTPSLSVAIDEIRKLSDNLNGSGRSVKDMCFATLGGAVVPYSQFYINGDEAKLLKVQEGLSSRKNGLAVRSDGKPGLEDDRFIGMPGIYRFSATDSTIKERGMRGLKGNRIPISGKTEETFITRLDAADVSVRQSPAFEAVRNLVVSGQDVFVLATPKVAIDPADTVQNTENMPGLRDEEHGWCMLGLSIADAERQVVPVGAASGQAAPLLAPAGRH